MATREKLEIIKESGEIFFYDIQPGREVINFGSHPDNDIVVTNPGISPFHAMLDLRRKPYQFVQLSETAETSGGDQILSPSKARDIHMWDTIELGDYRITLIESEVVEKRQQPEHSLTPQETGDSGKALARTGETGLLPPFTLAVRPPDQIDDAIVTEPVVPEYTIDAGQTLTLVFSISNGGETVADFEVSLEGLDPKWVTITPTSMHLKINQRASVTVSITPPREPASRAGPHHFAVTVTSPNYPGRTSRRGATLVINPFYEFAISDLSPRQLNISWDQRTATTSMAVINQGNSQTRYRVEGSDDDHACSFEFQSPGEDVRLANQTDFHLASDTTVVLPVFVTTRKRQLVGLRSRDLQFTVTATPLEGTQPPRTVLGRLYARPLIGPWLLLLILIALFVAAIYGFWPRMSLTVSPSDIRAGEPVELKWTSWPPIFMTLKLNGAPLEDAHGEQVQHPLTTTRFQLTGDTWASRLFSPGTLFSIVRTVNVTPVTPQILLFQAQPPQVNSGDFTDISWSVTGADRVVLVSDVFSQTLDNPEGSQKIRVERRTVFTLKAYNNSLPGRAVEQVLDVAVNPPPGSVAPVIQDFRVEPATISAGQPVTITWQVSGVNEVSIQSVGDHLPPSGSVSQIPAETTLYVLTASNGQLSTSALRQITVNPAPPTPTPVPTPIPTLAPAAPTIVLFTATPAQPIQLGDEQVGVRLDWVVSGDTTNITLTGGPLGNVGLAQLNPQDSLSLNLSEDAVFVLRAFNGSQQVLSTVEVRLQHPGAVGTGALAPYNLLGQIAANPNPPPDNGIQLTWAYNAPNSIVGFRLYRDNGSGFVQIVAEDKLTSHVLQYFDPTDVNCVTYYIVAVFQDANGQLLETAPSNQWGTACQ
jgi:hypothetical protein